MSGSGRLVAIDAFVDAPALVGRVAARLALRDLGQARPDVARTSRGLMTEALRAIERGSDDGLSFGASLSLGLAIGLLIGGAPRLLIVMALAPAAAIGLQIVDRQKGRTTRSSTTA